MRIKWPEDKQYGEKESYVWSVLKPADFNREVHLGWRYDASELKKLAAQKKRKRFARCTPPPCRHCSHPSPRARRS